MKRLLLVTVALALPLAAMAQSNDSMSNGTAASGMSNTASGSANDASPAGTSATGSATMSKLSLQDTHFINTAAIAGLAEVSDGKLATAKGDASVKSIGDKMVADHTAVNNQLTSLAKGKGVTPPMTVDSKHAAIHAQLTKLSGAGFDKKYLSTELTGHEMTIAAFKTEASTGSDPQLKSFASATLPQLENHLAMIKAAMK
jgi:putative membrane protein